MPEIIRIALAQINTTVGDLSGNRDKVLENYKKAIEKNCAMLVFPELTVCGYPPEDLLLKSQFVRDQKTVLDGIAKKVKHTACLIGFVDSSNGSLYNAAALIQHQKIQGVYRKIKLPNYSVFDEKRYFTAGKNPLIINTGKTKIGVSICEDIWVENGVTEAQAFCGDAKILVNISASPYHAEKGKERQQIMQSRAVSTNSFVVYCNLVGGQDELVFDGHSLVVGPTGETLAEGKHFAEDFVVTDLDTSVVNNINRSRAYLLFEKKCDFKEFEKAQLSISNPPTNSLPKEQSPKIYSKEEEIYKALVLGLHDYVIKNGFAKVTFGLSGGIDSALVAAIAVDALGNENVTAVSMPSRYSSKGSVDDAKVLAKNLNIRFMVLPIEEAFKTYLDILKGPFADMESDIAEENIQARIRGNLVMALSNKFGWMVLPTGNKSEVSVGYATIYGDMAGGFAPLKDVTKIMVYKLCQYRNELAGYDLIPQPIIDKPPSAELRPDQKDEDSLPPYDVLDVILEYYVECELGVKEIAKKGFDEETVRFVARLVDLSEYKRRQAAPGIKITPRAFGKDRRMPITNKYRAQ
jgi:NAD+ synthase (glutamine-hydrolysing)